MSSKLNIGSVIWNATTGVEVGTIVNSTQLDLKANKAQEAWIAPTLLNGWVNYGGGEEIAGYFKDEFGFVHLKGLIKSGTTTSGTVLFTLPITYRPSKNRYFAIALDQSSYGVIVILSSGNVLGGTTSSSWTSLDGISFKVGE